MRALNRIFRGRDFGQVKPLAKIINDLWKNGEQGVWYDVEAHRDAWNNVGPEQLTNGNFDMGLSGWSSVQPAGSSITAAGGSVAFTSDGASYAAFTQGNVFEIGKIYIVTLEGVSGTGSLKVVGVDTEVIFTTSRTIVGRATASSFSIARVAGVAASMSIEGVSVREWLGVTTCPLFQDASGTLPCYLPGQGQVDPPVGLLLDKRKGLTRGPELLTNGDFSAGSASWGVSGADATHIATFVNGALRYQSDTTSPVLLVSQLLQGGAQMVAGRWYEVTIVVSAWVSGGLKTDTFNGNSPAGLTLAQGVGTYRAVGLATSTTSSFTFTRNSANVDITIDSISIRELSGNHAYQTTTTSRPTLSARYNWATFTEDLTASVWQKGTPAFTITPKATLAPDGVSLADIVVSPDSGTPILSHVLTAQAPAVALSFFIKPIANASALSLLFRNNTTATNYDGTTLNTANGTVGVPAWVVTPAGNGWLKISYTLATGITAGDQISIYAGATGAIAVPGRMWSVWGLDVRSGNDGVGLPPYQRVKDSNTYDTIGFPLYLKFDGVDDSLLTADIDFSTVSSTIAVSTIRKLSDASRGIIFELGGTGCSSPGSFNQEMVWFSANVSTSYSGATGNATSTYPCIAPFSAVMSSAWNLSAPLQTFRVNGVLRSTSTVAVGGGMFQKAPLFIGRRNNSSVPFNGRLYSLIIRGAATPDSTIIKVERYLNQKAKVY